MQDLKKTTELKFTSSQLNDFSVSYVGLFDYSRAEKLQKDLHERCQISDAGFILGLQHPAVVTLGYRAEHSQEVNSQLSPIPVLQTQRGGLATLHSEGQLVIYPVFSLKKYNLGVKDYVQLLLQSTQLLLSELGVETENNSQAVGLYTQRGKIAFCGIQVKNGITMHGLSLNVSNDLGLFSSIRSCGVSEASFDRLADYNVDINHEKLFKDWVDIFTKGLYAKQK